MNRSDRERAIAIINGHIEQGKQVIRDKRYILTILQRDYHRFAMKFRFPWHASIGDPKMEILLREIDRQWNEINIQQYKNSQLRTLRDSIIQRAVATVPAKLLLVALC